MILNVNILICLFLCGEVPGIQSFEQVPWLPCQLVDESVTFNDEGHAETEYQHRDAGLQFGHPGDSSLNPNTITFLVTGSKVDMRKYIEGVVEHQLQCEIRRYSTEGLQMRWPGLGAQEHDIWFTCTIRHTDGVFIITSFLRHTPATPTPGQAHYRNWAAIADRAALTTSTVMLVLTRSPSVWVGLVKQQSLHCQFDVDHKAADLTVEWRFQQRGERTTLFSHSSRSGQTEGSGVPLNAIGRGNASLTLPLTKQSSEGTYVCLVSVPPLFGSHDITLHIMEPPRVSLNVDSTISLVDRGEQKVVCEAEGYYPLDVEMEWFREPSGGGLLPEKLDTVLYSSHRHHQDGTYSLSAFFLLHTSLHDSGSKYFCRVSHSSLRMPIRKSFTLIVTEYDSWNAALWLFFGFGSILVMVAILFVMLPRLSSAQALLREQSRVVLLFIAGLLYQVVYFGVNVSPDSPIIKVHKI
ncbi:tapasin-related protein-like isoform X1 [Salvelinus namaycush]|uniref:Tapasin-related protein-like isoform X1 n=1 Tax=Salvelinus namaycush TaxID=8040 RepID=A0A8U0PTJ8_SALNM|nr:tapasin-related protein-like isoform X1 [Salvelinus namaycush]